MPKSVLDFDKKGNKKRGIGLPEQNAQRIEQVSTGLVGKVSDDVYGEGWDEVTTIAPSKNAVYDKMELIAAGGAQFAFKTITGITNDVVADLAADTLTYTSANGILTIVGNAGTDTITFTVIEGQISLANLLEKNHASLANVTANQHINNLTDIPTRNHNDLQNIDAGDINHLTDVQVNALHAVLTNLTQLGTREHVALQNKNAEENVKHLTDAQLGALHTIYSLEVHDNNEHDPNYAAETRVFEKGSTFPVSPLDGDLHWDDVDEAWYRRDSTAQAWIQIGASGAGGDVYPKVGIASDDLVFSNDIERTSTSTTWVKLKEITVYINADIKMYWEAHHVDVPDSGQTRVRINGVAVGSAHNLTLAWSDFSENITIYTGDLVQIWGYGTGPGSHTVGVRNQRIKFIEYVSTAGY